MGLKNNMVTNVDYSEPSKSINRPSPLTPKQKELLDLFHDWDLYRDKLSFRYYMKKKKPAPFMIMTGTVYSPTVETLIRMGYIKEIPQSKDSYKDPKFELVVK